MVSKGPKKYADNFVWKGPKGRAFPELYEPRSKDRLLVKVAIRMDGMHAKFERYLNLTRIHFSWIGCDAVADSEIIIAYTAQIWSIQLH
eukprot:scaffold69068_cov25-Tisochrysis_lutea.AAC.1